MSIKKLFDSGPSDALSLKGLVKKTTTEFSADAESADYIKEYKSSSLAFVPPINYATASSFVKFGSAVKYYEDAAKRIYSQYPYDGSAAEQLQFKNRITPFEKHILENEYPRATGSAEFGRTWGGESTLTAGFGSSSNPEYVQFYGYGIDNIREASKQRDNNLEVNFDSGSTIEFWMKKEDWPNAATETERECIFQLYNTELTSELTLYTRRVLVGDTTTSSLTLDFGIGEGAVSGFSIAFTADLDTGLDDIADGDWHHYAISFQSSSSDLNVSIYVDGNFQEKIAATVNETLPGGLSGSLVGTIGALGNAYAGSDNLLGYGKLSASIDEFRFWKKERSAQDVGRNYFRNVYGGANTDDANTDLGVYFKFNEGTTGLSIRDTVVLDYSGRISNGTWTGYDSSTSRNVESAISASGFTEPGDPIIYIEHADVVSYIDKSKVSGSIVDAQNNSSLISSIPMWIRDEDSKNGGELGNFLQAIGSYLDTLHLQTSYLNKIRWNDYHAIENSFPYMKEILSSYGYEAPEIFVDSTILEKFFQQNNEKEFDKELVDIKNLIYRNIYNNLSYIYKSKGTEKAFRNLFRCYGVDRSLFDINIYSNNNEYVIPTSFDTYSKKEITLDFTNFFNAENVDGTIYSLEDSNDSIGVTTGIISGSSTNAGTLTLEGNAFFPKDHYQSGEKLRIVESVSHSLFGMHEADTTVTTETTVTDPNNAGFDIYAVRRNNLTKFVLSSSLGFAIESANKYDVYDNSKWNLSVRVKPTEYPFVDAISSSAYLVEFAGYKYELGELVDEFYKTSSLSNANGAASLTAPKRIYAGAKRTNITGSLLNSSNYRLMSLRYWQDYLEIDELKYHIRDIKNSGRLHPKESVFVFESGQSGSYVPKEQSLVLHWDFDNLSVTNANGEISLIEDVSSGSLGSIDKYGDYSKYRLQHTGYGKFFAEDSRATTAEFIDSEQTRPLEILNSKDMISILDSDDDRFERNPTPINYYYSFESSMYNVVSNKILEFFASLVDFNNLIGAPVNKYRTNYKDLDTLRQLFFARVENDLDVDKFISLYKWLDTALDGAIKNMIPASADASEEVLNVIESHVLERNKYRHELTVNKKTKSIGHVKNFASDGARAQAITSKDGNREAASKTTEGVTYKDLSGYKNPFAGNGSAGNAPRYGREVSPEVRLGGPASINKQARYVPPYLRKKFNVPRGGIEKISQDETKYSKRKFDSTQESVGQNMWWGLFAQRHKEFNEAAGVNLSRAQIHDVVNREYQQGSEKLYNFYADDPVYSPGLNRGKNQKQAHYRTYLSYASDQTTPEYYEITLDTQQIYSDNDFDHVSDIEKVDVILIKNGSATDAEIVDYGYLPFVINSGSTNRGYVADVDFTTNTGHLLDIIGQHEDEWFTGERALQSPFTRTHVVGSNHRKARISRASDTNNNREESYRIEVVSGALYVLSGRSHTLDGVDHEIPFSRFTSENTTRKSHNIKNIQHDTSSFYLGNYQQNYEVVQLNDRSANNLSLVDLGGAPPSESEGTFTEDLVDFTMPVRHLYNDSGSFTKTVFVNIFNSPGSVDTNHGFLDRASGQFSVYNALPWRNLAVIEPIKTLLTASSAFGGLQSGSTVTASFHGVYRNPIPRMLPTTTIDFESGSRSDNFFVQHSIPRTDKHYSWVTGTLIENKSMDAVYGHVNQSGEVVLNNTASTATVFEGSSSYYTNTSLLTASFGFPTWKQMRVGQHISASALRKTNIYSKTEKYRDAEREYEVETRFSHSPLTIKFFPIVQTLKQENELLDFNFSYANLYDIFGDIYDSGSNRIKNIFQENNIRTAKKKDYFNFFKLAGYETRNINYKEGVWPKNQRTYLSSSRTRKDFDYAWRSTVSDKIKTSTISKDENEFEITVYGLNQNFSPYPLDVTVAGYNGELVQGDNDTYYTLPAIEVSGFSVPYLSARYGRNYGIELPKNTAQQEGREPFYNTYSKFYQDIRLAGVGYSIIPEYIISNKIGAYISSSSRLLVDNTFNSLELEGVSTNYGTDQEFIEDFANSDHLSCLKEVKKDKKIKGVSLEVHGIKKLLPYDGFYPQDRMVQLAGLFYDSYTITATGENSNERTGLMPFYSPGIAFNSIKSGIAVDWPIVQPNIIADVATLSAEENGIYREAVDSLPFEAILDPVGELLRVTGSLSFIDTDVDIQIDSTASLSPVYDNRYKQAAENWFAMIPEVFLESGGVTKIRSKPSKDWVFNNISSSASGYEKYVGYIKLRKSANFSLYDAPNYFGHTSDLVSTANVHHVPPYYRSEDVTGALNAKENSGWCKVTFDPGLMLSDDSEKLRRGSFNLGDIFRHSTFECKNDFMESSAATGYMTLSASLNINNDKSLKHDGSWEISTKWESPVLNFANVTALDSNSQDVSGINRGMWHQYGVLPQKNEGIFLELANTHSGSIDETNESFNRIGGGTSSLFEAVGFETSQMPIGDIAEEKSISEYVVVIPFYEEGGEEKFFELDLNEFERAYDNMDRIDSSIKDMINKSRKVILPPKIDFIKTRDTSRERLEKNNYLPIVAPFAMYLYEFKHSFSRQDLADWWQGILPSSSKIAQKESINIYHEYKEGELLSPSTMANNGFRNLPDDVRFKVFKVKKRASGKYNKLFNDGENDFDYSYNWPYDFFSLVEMAKVEVSLDFEEK